MTVLDKPTKPQGPLDVSNVYEDCCDLEWRAPKDDGGEPIEYYEIEKMDTASGKWVPAGKSKDTKFHVDGLKKGQNYMFRVKAVNKEGPSDALQTEKSTLAKNPYGESQWFEILNMFDQNTLISDEPGAPGQPTFTDWDSDHVDLEWDPPTSDGGAPITGYIIEKKTKHGRDWTEAAVIKEAKCSGRAPGLKEGEEYQFRVKAVNKAGPGAASPPSERIIAKPRFCKERVFCNLPQTQ